MIHRMLKLTPLNAQNEENILEIDADLVIGWMGFSEGCVLYLMGPTDHSTFSVKESVDDIKKQLHKLSDGNSSLHGR